MDDKCTLDSRNTPNIEIDYKTSMFFFFATNLQIQGCIDSLDKVYNNLFLYTLSSSPLQMLRSYYRNPRS